MFIPCLVAITQALFTSELGQLVSSVYLFIYKARVNKHRIALVLKALEASFTFNAIYRRIGSVITPLIADFRWLFLNEPFLLSSDGVQATEDAIGARVGHADGVPEQKQDAGRGATQPRAARARGARGRAARSARTEGTKL